MELGLFDQVGDAVVTMLDADYDDVRRKAHRYGLKVWFGPVKPPKAHYECQMIDRTLVDGTPGWAIETGFHLEHRDPADNDAVLARLRSAEKKWRKALGAEAELAGFYGRPDEWHRLSEAWVEPEDPDIVIELAGRLTDYIEAIEPIIRTDG